MATKTSVIRVSIIGDADSVKAAFGETVAGAQRMESDSNKAFSGFGKDAEDTSTKSSGAFKTMGAAAGGFLVGGGLQAIVGFGSELLTLGSTLDTMAKKADAVFGPAADQVRRWADDNNEAFGTSKEAVVGMATNMADLLKPMGFTSEAAAGMSQEMIGMSGALSAWSGGTKSAAEVSELLSDAMLGETDGLKQLGIGLSQADVDARVAANGQSELTGAAMDMARAQATQQLIMEKSADAQKAWNDGTMDSVKKQNEAKAQVEQLKASLAQGLVPVFQGFVGFITGTAVPAFQAIGGFVMDNKDLFIAFGIGILATVVPAFVAWAISAGAAAVATVIAAAPVIALGLAVAGLAAGIIWLWKNFDGFRGAVLWVKDAIVGLWSWVTNNWQTILLVLTGPFGGAIALIRTHWDTLKGWVQDFPGFVGTALEGVADALTWPFRTAFNGIARLWNSTVGALSFSIPGWVPGVGGKGWSVPDIPTFALGGIVKGGRGGILGIIGEQQHDEAIVPLPRGGGALGGATTYNIKVMVPPSANTRDIGRELRRVLTEYDRSAGLRV